MRADQWYRRTVRDETVSFLLNVFGVCLLSLCGSLCCCALWLCWLFVVYFACCAELYTSYILCGVWFDVIMAFFELSVNRCPSLWRFVRGGDAAGLQVLGSGSGVGKGCTLTYLLLIGRVHFTRVSRCTSFPQNLLHYGSCLTHCF